MSWILKPIIEVYGNTKQHDQTLSLKVPSKWLKSRIRTSHIVNLPASSEIKGSCFVLDCAREQTDNPFPKKPED